MKASLALSILTLLFTFGAGADGVSQSYIGQCTRMADGTRVLKPGGLQGLAWGHDMYMPFASGSKAQPRTGDGWMQITYNQVNEETGLNRQNTVYTDDADSDRTPQNAVHTEDADENPTQEWDI